MIPDLEEQRQANFILYQEAARERDLYRAALVKIVNRSDPGKWCERCSEIAREALGVKAGERADA